MKIDIPTPKIKLEPILKKAWVKALRSGKYKQGTGSLRDGNEFCCLGVYCDVVYGLKIGEMLHVATSFEFLDVKDETFFRQSNSIFASSIQGLLASNNDNGATFDELADWIEANC